MIRLFLKEKKQSFFIFCFFLIWVNLLLFIDKGFQSVSLFYLNGTLLFFGILFLSFSFLNDQRKLQKLFPEEKNFQQYQSYFNLYENKQTALKTETEDFRNELAVEVLEQKDEQLSWVHEVKTPLTAMQLLLNQLPSSKEKSALQVEWTRIHLLLDQTLHTLRLQEIEQDYLLSTTTLKELVLPEIKELQSWCFSKGIQLNIEELHFSTITDQKWARFIIRQILSNAIKYSNPDSEIDILGNLNDAQQVCLTITDYGIGIPTQDLPRIFQKGFTGSAGRRQSASTGMGLYLANNAAQKLSITIEVESNQGKTSFTLMFPAQNNYSKVQSS